MGRYLVSKHKMNVEVSVAATRHLQGKNKRYGTLHPHSDNAFYFLFHLS